jgi:hypothetical protein
MSTVTKLVLGAMGKLRPEPAKGAGPDCWHCPRRRTLEAPA